jgi:methylisocitrate lyase
MGAFYGDLARTGSQAAWLDRMQTRRELYELIGYHDYEALDESIARSTLPDERPDGGAPRHGGP